MNRLGSLFNSVRRCVKYEHIEQEESLSFGSADTEGCLFCIPNRSSTHLGEDLLYKKYGPSMKRIRWYNDQRRYMDVNLSLEKRF
jgi:hypothetical protein